MSRDKRLVLSLVERGWHAARECSLALHRDGIATLHLVKGRLPPEVSRLVSQKPGVGLSGVPYHLFWPAAYLVCRWWCQRGRLLAVLVDNDRSRRRVSGWLGREAGRVVLVQDTDAGWQCARGGRSFPSASWREAFADA
jgi:hypothetical protein